MPRAHRPRVHTIGLSLVLAVVLSLLPVVIMPAACVTFALLLGQIAATPAALHALDLPPATIPHIARLARAQRRRLLRFHRPYPAACAARDASDLHALHSLRRELDRWWHLLALTLIRFILDSFLRYILPAAAVLCVFLWLRAPLPPQSPLPCAQTLANECLVVPATADLLREHGWRAFRLEDLILLRHDSTASPWSAASDPGRRGWRDMWDAQFSKLPGNMRDAFDALHEELPLLQHAFRRTWDPCLKKLAEVQHNTKYHAGSLAIGTEEEAGVIEGRRTPFPLTTAFAAFFSPSDAGLRRRTALLLAQTLHNTSTTLDFCSDLASSTPLVERRLTRARRGLFLLDQMIKEYLHTLNHFLVPATRWQWLRSRITPPFFHKPAAIKGTVDLGAVQQLHKLAAYALMSDLALAGTEIRHATLRAALDMVHREVRCEQRRTIEVDSQQTLWIALNEHAVLLKRSFRPLAERLAGFNAQQWEEFQKTHTGLSMMFEDHQHPIWPLWATGARDSLVPKQRTSRWNLRPRRIGHSLPCVIRMGNGSIGLGDEGGATGGMALSHDDDSPRSFFCVSPLLTGMGDEQALLMREARLEREEREPRRMQWDLIRAQESRNHVDSAWMQDNQDEI